MQISSVLSALPPIIMDHLGWWIAGLIVVVGLLVIGLRDVMRFSWSRVWAISSVCFAESIRRRVWLIPPLAIVGVIVVSQLQKPIDEQDAVLQTIKFCLFATGLVVVTATIILAATNLPREIENRVIYTIVTKPTTRLEVILGKVVGFARVSALILIIMGLFTWGYLQFRAWNFRQDVQARLESGEVPSGSVAMLRHYAEPGALLQAKTFREPDLLNIYARLPEPTDAVRWTMGSGEQDILVPFDLRKSDLVPIGDPSNTPGSLGLGIRAHVIYQQRAATTEEIQEQPTDVPPDMRQMPPMPGMPGAPGMPPGAPPMGVPTTAPVQPTPMMMSVLAVQDTAGGDPAAVAPTAPAATTQSLQTPRVTFAFVDREFYTVVPASQINGGRSVEVPPPQGGDPTVIELPPNIAGQLANAVGEEPTRVYLQISGRTAGVMYAIAPEGVSLLVPDAFGGEPKVLKAATGPDGVVQYRYRGRTGTHGQQLRGPSANKDTPVGVYSFRDAELPGTEQVPFEMRLGIERSGSEAAVDEEDPTNLTLQIRNLQTNQLTEPITLSPESNRRLYFTVPASAVAGGNFDVVLRTLTPGHYVGLWTPPAARPSLVLVSDQQSFAFNLFKSLLIMWLLTILVVIISIFCSTFLSWPIAIVLTLVILLGRWGVEQIGDANLGPGIGNQVATELGFKGSAPSKVISESVEKLSALLKLVSAVLPDISKFPAMEAIERGMTVSGPSLLAALTVLIGYGLPMMVLSYIFLKNKEVAP